MAGKQSLEIDPDLYQAYNTLGELYLKNGECEEAQKAMERYLEVRPNSPESHNYLGIAYVCLKQFDKAVKEFEWAIRIDPNSTFAHLNLGKIYWYKLQNRHKALYHLKFALRLLDPSFPDREEITNLVRLLEGLS
jgi:tetratricopeptide (TPR) repeat protein